MISMLPAQVKGAGKIGTGPRPLSVGWPQDLRVENPAVCGSSIRTPLAMWGVARTASLHVFICFLCLFRGDLLGPPYLLLRSLQLGGSQALLTTHEALAAPSWYSSCS